jgi:CRP-like cAMP-binding protein
MPASAESTNIVLATLPADERSRVDPLLTRVPLRLRHVVEKPGQPIEHAYFPESGLASFIVGKEPRRIEVGLAGRDGMVGMQLAMGDGLSPHETLIQAEGEALRLDADALRRAMQASPPLRLHLLKFVDAFMVQTAHTALANGHASLEARLSRWLLMAHDRGDGEEVFFTHEFLALMLGVRRPGVTLAIHELEGHGLIKAGRKLIAIVDRAGLERQAGAIYGPAEAHYRRLVGRPIRSDGAARPEDGREFRPLKTGSGHAS